MQVTLDRADDDGVLRLDAGGGEQRLKQLERLPGYDDKGGRPKSGKAFISRVKYSYYQA